MTIDESALLILYLAFAAAGYWLFFTYSSREIRRQSQDARSRIFPAAAAGSQFIPLFDRAVGPHSVLYIPAGDGLYPTRHKPARNKEYLDRLARWMQNGAVIHVIVTIPSTDAEKAWQNLKNDNPEHLHVHFLDRRRASGAGAEEIRTVIGRLDTFHASIVVNPVDDPKGPGAMWIEANHPIGAKHAYHVEFVSPKDAATDERLQKYQALYERILNEPCGSELTATGTLAVPRETIAA